MNILDRYTSLVSVALDRYQLVGITALWVASKYEDVHPFSHSDASYITDHAFDKDEVLAMEFEILTVLEFDLTCPKILTFLTRVSQIAGITHDPQACFFAMYLCELSLYKVNLQSFNPSRIATASVYLTCKMMKLAPVYTETIKRLIIYPEHLVRACDRELADIFP